MNNHTNIKGTVVKLELKSVKYSPHLSVDSNAFTANVYIGGKKAGWAKDAGYGGCLEVRIDSKFDTVIEQNARTWIDHLDPNPVDHSKPGECVEGNMVWHRKPCAQRDEGKPSSYLEDAISQMVCNFIVIRDLKKYKNKVCHTVIGGKCNTYATYKLKPEQLSEDFKRKTEKESDFGEWLHSMSYEELAIKLGYRDGQEGPLTMKVG